MPPWKPNAPSSGKDFAKAAKAANPNELRASLSIGQQMKYDEISARARVARSKAERLHKDLYPKKFAEELKRQFERGSGERLDLKPRGVASPKKGHNEIQVKAAQNVEVRHQLRLNRIDMAETKLKLDFGRKAIEQSLKQASKSLKRDWTRAVRGPGRDR